MPNGDPAPERHEDEFESRLQDNAARVGARHHRQYVYFAGSVTVIGPFMAVSAASNFTALRLLGSVFVLCSPFLFLQADRARVETLRREDVPEYLKELGWFLGAVVLAGIGNYLASRSDYSA